MRAHGADIRNEGAPPFGKVPGFEFRVLSCRTNTEEAIRNGECPRFSVPKSEDVRDELSRRPSTGTGYETVSDNLILPRLRGLSPFCIQIRSDPIYFAFPTGAPATEMPIVRRPVIVKVLLGEAGVW